VHHLERGGVDRVAAEVAQEVAVLLQDDDINAHTSEKEAEHYAGWPSTGDAALGLHGAW
jgi:hypothetical protein